VKLEFASADDNDQKQIEQINRFIDEKVDLLIVAPNQVATISPVIDKAYGKGIPVIVFDRKTNSHKYTAFMGADNFEIGRTMGELIASQLNGHGDVVEITGLKGSSPAIDRHNGFVSAISKYPGIKLTSSKLGDWTEESGSKAMREVLKKVKHIDCVFGHNDRLAIGARKEAERSGIVSGVRYYGVDALPTPGGGIEHIQKGILTASYIYPTRGNELLHLALNILEKKPYKKENLLKSAVVNSDNADVLMMQYQEQQRQSENLETLHGKVDQYFDQVNVQEMIILLFSILIAGAIATAYFIYRSYLMKARLSEELQKRNDELQRLSKELEDMTNARLTFFTNVSHELRTPLTLVSDPVTQLLNDRAITGDAHELLELVHRNVNILVQLVNEILDFRKIQNGKMELKLRKFAIVESLNSWNNDFRNYAAQKGIRLQTEFSVAAGSEMIADKDRVAHLYFNLMTNALKYTPSGGTITTALSEEGSCYVLTVEDNGVGIAEKDVPLLFERFYQVQGTSGGTGIGLAIVKAFADLHHGQVKAESEKGKGTRFIITLPKSQDGPLHGEPACTQVQPRMGMEQYVSENGNMRQRLDDVTRTEEEDKPEILIIDDNNDVRTYLRSILKKDYHVTEAADGKAGLKEAWKNVPDLVVSDVMMPVMDGLEFCQLLKTDTVTCHIPVILLTARTLDKHKVEAYENGADAYITKPFAADLLLARIDNLLKSRQMLRKAFSGEQMEGEKIREADSWGDKDNKFVKQLRNMIQEYLGDSDLNVEKMGEELGMSRVQLYRKVKALTGQSPVELLRKARVSRGKKLLETTDKSISEIAYEVGFTAPSYFTKCFKDEYGIRPNEISK
jgi:signal transduction histidine kinase/DNA-binding response OmpR family regulator